MSLFKSGNPAFSEKNFQTVFVGDNDHAMTVKGTLNKFGFMLLMLLGTAYYSWKEFAGGGNVMPLMWTGLIGGFVLAIVIMFKKEWAGYLSPLYALLNIITIAKTKPPISPVHIRGITLPFPSNSFHE